MPSYLIKFPVYKASLSQTKAGEMRNGHSRDIGVACLFFCERGKLGAHKRVFPTRCGKCSFHRESRKLCIVSNNLHMVDLLEPVNLACSRLIEMLLRNIHNISTVSQNFY